MGRSRPVGAYVWVLGSRSLPSSAAPLVSRVVAGCVRSGLGIGSGGALGADLLVLSALLSLARALPYPEQRRVLACSPLVLAWCSFAGLAAAVRPVVAQYARLGGRVRWGHLAPGAPFASVRTGLLERSRLLGVSGQCVGAVAFFGPGRSAGSAFSLSLVAARVPVFAFVVGAPTSVLPPLSGGGAWVPASLCGLPCFRWVPKPFVH